MAGSPDPPSREEELDRILADYLHAAEAVGDAEGIASIREEVLKKHPGFQSELREFFTGEDWLLGGEEATPSRLPDFGDYEQIEYRGEGGFGVVYKAWQKSLEKWVAVKVSRRKIEEEVDPRLTFDGRMMAQLKHPNIVPVHDMGTCNGRPYFSMELMEGGESRGSAPRIR